MKLTNMKAVEFLASTDLYDWPSKSSSHNNVEQVIEVLVMAGFIIPDPPKSRPVEIAEAAKSYLTSCNVTHPEVIFNTASGWDNEAWDHVLKVKTGFHTRQEIFKALRLLAEEAGV